MTLRIRQIVLVARDLDPVAADLEAVFSLRVAFRDPGVAEFGLHNVLMPVGDQFLEVISPTRPGTAAGRMLERRGDGGYMLILQTDDFDGDRKRLDQLGVRVIWNAQHEDIRAMHLHPKDIGGAIVSIDQPTPPESWRWAGPNWRDYVAPNGAKCVLEAEVEAPEPSDTAQRWSKVLGLANPADADGGYRLALRDGSVRFVATKSRVEGLSAFRLAVPSVAKVIEAARSRGLPAEGHAVRVAGVRFDLREA